jgi:flagellar hook-basal body complex protein FliE
MPIPINPLDPALAAASNAISGAISGAVSSASASSANGMPLASAPGAAPATAPFADLFTDAVGKVNQLDDQARSTVDGLMTGNGVDVHQAMIATEKADMAFEFALAVRNKAVQAYQTVIGMQF